MPDPLALSVESMNEDHFSRLMYQSRTLYDQHVNEKSTFLRSCRHFSAFVCTLSTFVCVCRHFPMYNLNSHHRDDYSVSNIGVVISHFRRVVQKLKAFRHAFL